MKKVKCQECGYSGVVPDSCSDCPLCHSNKTNCIVCVDESLVLSEAYKMKAKQNGVKKAIKEFQCGDEYSHAKKKMVDKTRLIDRKENQYFEEVVDKETGEIIHSCSEPLSEHFGHGTAKKKV